MADTFTEITDDITEKETDKIVREVKRNTPVDTGKLRKSIHKEKTSEGFKITTDVDYAPYVENRYGMFAIGANRAGRVKNVPRPNK